MMCAARVGSASPVAAGPACAPGPGDDDDDDEVPIGDPDDDDWDDDDEDDDEEPLQCGSPAAACCDAARGRISVYNRRLAVVGRAGSSGIERSP